MSEKLRTQTDPKYGLLCAPDCQSGGHSAKTIMEEMHHLDSMLSWRNGANKPEMHIEEPNEVQAQVLPALGYQVKDRVLDAMKSKVELLLPRVIYSALFPVRKQV